MHCTSRVSDKQKRWLHIRWRRLSRSKFASVLRDNFSGSSDTVLRWRVWHAPAFEKAAAAAAASAASGDAAAPSQPAFRLHAAVLRKSLGVLSDDDDDDALYGGSESTEESTLSASSEFSSEELDASFLFSSKPQKLADDRSMAAPRFGA